MSMGSKSSSSSSSSSPHSFQSETHIIQNAAKDVWDRSLPGKIVNPPPQQQSNTQFQSKLYSKKSSSSSSSTAAVGARKGRTSSSASTRAVSAIGSVAITPLLTEAFARIGMYTIQFNKLQYPQVPRGVTELTLVFHGPHGQDVHTDALMKSLNETKSTTSSSMSTSYNFMMNWELYSQNMIQASFNGDRIGREVAKRLPARIRRVHIIGISVGAHAAEACVRQLKQDRHDRIYIQETLLDPVCAKGVLDLEYGIREFGSMADYAQQFVNTDDVMPFSNSPCLKCAVFDITACRPEEIRGHDWPLVYYAQQQLQRDMGFVQDSNKKGRGVVVVIDK